MGLPGFGDGDVRRTTNRSGLDDVVSDLGAPKRMVRAGKSGRTAALLQLFLGYVGGGYFYLEDRRRGMLSGVVFVLGAAAVIYLEMLIFPSALQANLQLMWVHYVAVGVFLVLAGVYFATVYDCYIVGSALERKVAGGVHGSMVARELSPQEKIDRVFSEHDRGGSDLT